MGGYQALFLSIMGIIDKGDEVIIMEPYFDCYADNVKSAGGTPRFISFKLVIKTSLEGKSVNSDPSRKKISTESLLMTGFWIVTNLKSCSIPKPKQS